MTNPQDEKPDEPTYVRIEAKQGTPTYIMVPRKLVIGWISSFLCMFVMTLLSGVWTIYIDKQSNQRWCGIVNLFNSAYEETPPPTAFGKRIAAEFVILQRDFECKKTRT